MLHDAIELRAAARVGKVLREKYRIERVLGAGGMATVYAAVHRNGSRVALKVLHEELSVRGDIRARFVREGYVANMVGHPGAVKILDDDVAEDGSPFLVMELLTGETLRALCRRLGGRLEPREALALGHQLLDVLGAAHAAGIVHRDIKPENLFLTTARTLKVLDFGIARIEDDPGGLATATGTRLGTPAFMPPELALGRTSEIDGRTDLWSAGATLFQMLSGQIVHEAPAAAEIVVRAATVPARSLATAAPGVPAEVVSLVDRALRFVREDRWPSARAMQQAIEEAHTALFGEEIRPLETVPAPQPEGLETAPGTVSVTSEVNERPRGPRGGVADDSTLFSPSSAPVAGAMATVASAGGPEAPMARALAPVPGPSSPASAPGPATIAGPTRRRAAFVTALVAALAGGAAYFLANRTSDGDGSAAPGAPAGLPATVAARSGCQKNTNCVPNREGRHAICRKEDGVCVTLESDECEILAEPGDAENDATLWIGAMWPVNEPDPLHYGPRSANAIRLARRDFAETSGGLLPAQPGGSKRPIGVVLCDDAKDAARVADHLVHELRVPAVLGFRTSKEVLDLASSHFLPAGVLAISGVNTAKALRDIPHPPGEPRLVWRTNTATDAASWPFAMVLEHVIEPELRSIPGLLRPGEPIRAAQLRQDSVAGQSTVESRIATLRFNGKSVAENGDAFRQIARADTFGDRPVDAEAANERTARDIAELAPHVILDMPQSPSLLAVIERRWPRSSRWRPRYLSEGCWTDLGPPSFDWQRDDLYRRIHSVNPSTTGAPLVRFALRYSEHFTPKATPATAPNGPYDAFYLVAYAAAAAGDQPITGKALARAIARLLPPGQPVEVGPGGIYPALLALAAGKNIDLLGAASTLDMSPETGETSTDWSLFCLAPAGGGRPAREVESGLWFDARARRVIGERRCP